MAEGDLHVEQKRGAWQIEEEGRSRHGLRPVEQLASREQAWRIALYYAEASKVDVFLHERGGIKDEKRFRAADPRRRRR